MRIGFSTRIGRHMRIGMSVPVRSYNRHPAPRYQTPTERNDVSLDRLMAIVVLSMFAFFLVGGFIMFLTLPH